MNKRLICTTAAVFVLSLALSGCTLFRWGGPSKSSEPAPAPAEPKSGDTFKEGEELMEKGKYEQARKVYAKVQETDPEKSYEPLIQIRLGDSYYEEASYAEAEVEYQRFLDMRPHNKAAPYVKYQIGMCNYKQIGTSDRDPQYAQKTVKAFIELLKDYPDNPYADEAKERLRLAYTKLAENDFVIGKYYLDQKQYKAAADRFKEILDSYPGSQIEPEVMYALADTYITMGQFDDAKNTLAKLYQAYPNHTMALKAKDKLSGKIPAN